jgi:hypothetical protein
VRYSWARYYRPGLQRFISEDPIGFAAGDVNLYAYGANNPLRFVDSLGLDKQAAEEPCRLDMPLTAGWRLPDYLSLNVNFPIPWLSARTDDWVGRTFQFALDREGRLYGGLGPQVGKSRFRASASLTAGLLLQKHKPSKERLEAFMTGHSFNLGVGHGLGGQVTMVLGVCSALEAGLFTPDQFGAAYHYSKRVGEFPVSW